MNTSLDMIGAFILAGMMILSFNQFMVTKQSAELLQTNQIITQTSIASTTQIMMYDLRKAGYRAPGAAFLTANTSSLRFVGDVDNNGSLDTVAYTWVANNGNPLLVRYSQGSSSTSDLDISRLEFRYYDNSNAATTNPADVKHILVTMYFEEHMDDSETSRTVKSDFRISPKNL